MLPHAVLLQLAQLLQFVLPGGDWGRSSSRGAPRRGEFHSCTLLLIGVGASQQCDGAYDAAAVHELPRARVCAGAAVCRALQCRCTPSPALASARVYYTWNSVTGLRLCVSCGQLRIGAKRILQDDHWQLQVVMTGGLTWSPKVYFPHSIDAWSKAVDMLAAIRCGHACATGE